MRVCIVALACAFVITASRPAAAAPPCTGLAACEVACKDGQGPDAACTVLADALFAGNGKSPDRVRAVRLYRGACGLPTDDAGVGPPAPDGDAAACIALADIVKTGWLFEVERDAGLNRMLTERARTLAQARCVDGDASGCGVAARAAREQGKDADAVKHAERGCAKARDFAACKLLDRLAFAVDSKDDDETRRLRGVIRSGIEDACVKDLHPEACLELATAAVNPKIRAATDKLCAAGDQRGCVATDIQIMTENRKDLAKLKPTVAHAIATCDGDGHSLCADIADSLVAGEKEIGLAADPGRAIAILERRCKLDDVAACRRLSRVYGAGGPPALRDPEKYKTWGERACSLTHPTDECAVCDDEPGVASCQLRAAFEEHERCYAAEPGACERVARRFRAGNGVAASNASAAKYLRRGCDSAEKSACISLDDLCVTTKGLDPDVCHQALIHSDLFYEAEWKLRTTGNAGMVDGNAAPVTAAPSTVSVAEAGGGDGGIQLRRGKLDADLVVDVVLDRARQAAIKLVVDELIDAEDKARYRYLADLLDQGAALLADPSTLRREKFHDLGMTVVRAFVAANLVDSLYPTAGDLFAAPIIGDGLRASPKDVELGIGKKIPGRVHGYLVDVAYRYLGGTRLFARTTRDPRDGTVPTCPWSKGAGATLCTQLADTASVEAVLRLDRVLDGIRLAKALREAGFDELRRLVEAVTRSRTIADFDKTPGLNLRQWKSILVAGSRARIARLQAQIVDLRSLTRASAFADTGPTLAALASRAAGARAALDSKAIRIVVGSLNASHIMKIVRAIELALPKGRSIADAEALDTARKVARAAIQAWGARDIVDLGRKLDDVDKTIGELRPAFDRLEAAIADIEALIARFRPDGKPTLELGDLPLFALADLTREFRAAASALATVEDRMRAIYPGEVQAQLQFARSAAVRLLGFLDLMERLARSSRLTQTCGEVIAALGTLGSNRHGVFTAPLYDVLEPVLGAIKTHEPMSLDLLFAVIGRVRLDTLIGSLQGGGNACADDGGVDCWTVKLIHALQESVEREGDSIRVDGGKFAHRLARHGDDYRRRHTWRGYFHLTVGFGALRSDPVGDTTDARRNVPLISEQVGFGFASPSFWRDRLTFKIGAAASGLLYRAVLDSEESDAIMAHPVLFAIDVADLVEAYVSPAMLLVYPPTDMRETSVRWGIGVGLSVPLGSYLERL